MLMWHVLSHSATLLEGMSQFTKASLCCNSKSWSPLTEAGGLGFRARDRITPDNQEKGEIQILHKMHFFINFNDGGLFL